MIRPTVEGFLGLLTIGGGAVALGLQAESAKEWTAFACVISGFFALLYFVLKKHPQDMRSLITAVKRNSETSIENSRLLREAIAKLEAVHEDLIRIRTSLHNLNNWTMGKSPEPR